MQSMPNSSIDKILVFTVICLLILVSIVPNINGINRTNFGIIFKDNFESGTLDKWNVISGNWSVITDGANHVAHLTRTSTPNRRMVSKENVIDNIFISGKVKGLADIDCADMAIGFYSNSTGTYFYYVILSSNHLGLRRFENGNIYNIGDNPSVKFENNIWYSVRIKLESNNIYAKAWEVGSSEPSIWQIAYSEATSYGNYLILGGISGQNNEEFWFDDIVVTSENQPPNTPSNPNPSNHQTNVYVNTTLSWTCEDPDNDPLTYDIYFGTTISPSKIVSNQSSNNYNPASISYNKKYYWRIVAWDDHNHYTSSPIWDFTTEKTSNNPPYPPGSPTPLDGDINVPINIDLGWVCVDPDFGDILTYDVYFGSMLPLQKVASNISNPTFNPGVLNYGLTYFWTIIAWDNHDASASSPSWYFTTQETNNPPNIPTKPNGQTSGKTGVVYKYSSSTTDPDENQIKYGWDWDSDMVVDEWTGLFDSGEIVEMYHSWDIKGTYEIRVKAKDINGEESDWSEPLSVSMPKNKLLYQFPLSKTLYVGGDGPENYSKIQDAIDNASNRDTIYVYSGIYYEQLSINSNIILIGENKNTTFIDNNRTNGDTITVYANEVTITGFTIQHSGKQEGDSGIKLHSNNNNIIGNIISENGWRRNYYKQGGLYLNESSHNNITNNVITGNREAGIYLHHANYNIIQNNIIYDNGFLAIISNASSYNMIAQNDVYENYCGMTFWPYSTYNNIVENHIHDHPGCGIAFKIYSDYNIIRYNNFTNNLEWSIMLGFGPTKHNVIEYNTIRGTTGGQQNWFDGSGLVLSIAFYNSISKNNFLGNKNDVYLENSLLNLWNQNYWENHQGSGAKIIQGHFAKPYIYHPEIKIPWFAIDWQPAQEPYDIVK